MTKDGKIRVLIVDDHAVLRSGLHLLLDAQSDNEVVGEAGDVKEAVFEARAKKPDIVLMDVVMPGQTGIEGVPLVLKEAPEAKVLVLSMQDDPRYVLHREHEHLRFRRLLEDERNALDPGLAGHDDVHQHDVRLLVPRLEDGLLDVPGLADDLDV